MPNFTLNQVASICGVPVYRVRGWVERGFLKTWHCRDEVFIQADELWEFLAEMGWLARWYAYYAAAAHHRAFVTWVGRQHPAVAPLIEAAPRHGRHRRTQRAGEHVANRRSSLKVLNARRPRQAA